MGLYDGLDQRGPWLRLLVTPDIGPLDKVVYRTEYFTQGFERWKEDGGPSPSSGIPPPHIH